jgi:hypothetical protein
MVVLPVKAGREPEVPVEVEVEPPRPANDCYNDSAALSVLALTGVEAREICLASTQDQGFDRLRHRAVNITR